MNKKTKSSKKQFSVTKEELELLYLKEKLGTELISRKLNIPRGIIRSFLKDFGISLRQSNARIMNLEGLKFNSLLVIKRTDIIKNKQRVWECLCDCGNTCFIKAYEIKGGYVKTCGCSRLKQGKKHFLWRGFGEISKNKFNKIRYSAIKRNIDFNITIQEIWHLFLKQNKKCALTGADIKFATNHKDKTTASLDRIDSSKSYCLSNVQWVHVDINLMKQDYDQDKFISLCKQVAEFNVDNTIKPTKHIDL